jgi:hypothetical protein
MDYLEDLSIVDDDDNDDKRLLWKSKENIMPNEVNNENNIMDSNELSSLELNVNIDNTYVKRRHRPRPFDTLIVMVCLYYRAHKP